MGTRLGPFPKVGAVTAIVIGIVVLGLSLGLALSGPSPGQDRVAAPAAETPGDGAATNFPADRLTVTLPTPRPCPTGVVCACAGVGIREWHIEISDEGIVEGFVGSSKEAIHLVWGPAYRLATIRGEYVVVDDVRGVLARNGSRFAEPELCGLPAPGARLEVLELGSPLP